MATPLPRPVMLRYEVSGVRPDWTLSEEQVPESRPHDRRAKLVDAILSYWALRTGRDAKVGRNLAIRWDRDRPGIGVDPDVYVVEPSPPEGDELTSLRLWEEGHHPPLLAVEIVSPSRAGKDYGASPEKYAACGARELWVFDPDLAGPSAYGGPCRLQVWARSADGAFERIYAGEGPVRSPALGGFVFVVDEGQQLRVASDEAGTAWWLTAEEAERIEKERERAEKERERAEKDRERAEKKAALARADALEAELARLRGGA